MFKLVSLFAPTLVGVLALKVLALGEIADKLRDFLDLHLRHV